MVKSADGTLKKKCITNSYWQQPFYKTCVFGVGQQVLFIFKVKMFSGKGWATLEKHHVG